MTRSSPLMPLTKMRQPQAEELISAQQKEALNSTNRSSSLGIEADVKRLFSGIGWLSYMSVNCPAYVELVQEFYATFTFTKPEIVNAHTPDLITFRLLGKSFSLFILEFNVALGFVDEGSFSHDVYFAPYVITLMILCR
ncbi:hypothetical protein GH714_014942 [Hevea brasiliensis]|uniref:Uncharacterized protein n=1 Tax=Hevea brasiliensis TaxID=3981 RepID=A0A6A6L347_HEVBR|nr:hypothetical protein GH714_014942 [Hevea brasiliensis]